MTISEAIIKCDTICPNTVDNRQKKDMLSLLDGRVKAEIFDKYADNEGADFSRYTDSTPDDTVLLIPFPFDNIYTSWLIAQVYLAMGEYVQYNNWMTIYNSEWDSYDRYYAQGHHAKGADTLIYF